MSEYILLLRGGNRTADNASRKTLESAVQSYRDWANQLHEENRLVDASKLKANGRRLVKKSDSIQVDGPFTETKETIGGFYIIKADSLAEIEQIARQCPIYAEGGRVEIREIQS